MRTLVSSIAAMSAVVCINPACSSTADDCHEGSTCSPTAGAAGTSVGHAGASGASAPNSSSGGHAGRTQAGEDGGDGGDGGTSGGTGDAGDAGDAGAGGESASACDPTSNPSAEACLISNEFAIFVDPDGKDSAAGTKSAPVHTITQALQLAGDAKIVIACIGTYDDQVKIIGRAKLYGGFACSGSAAPWTYMAGARTKIAPSARGFALDVEAGAAEVEIEDFEFDAEDGADAGESSIAAFVKESTRVAFHRVKLLAGKGVDGADGTLTKATFKSQSELNGKAASDDLGGDPNLVTCSAGGTTRGGRGGDGGGNGSNGNAGLPDLGAGQSGTVGSCGASGTGKDGADAPAQPPSPGASKLGTITPTGWRGLSGTDGTPGIPGQGGGGGAGAPSGGGGGGGAGGCGGSGGTGGKAGGSSIALLLLNSALTIDASELSSGNAGNGGKGVAGQDGQPESGKAGLQVPDGCAGGKGGKGGAGGAGGGAAGGISAGIIYRGTAPSPDAATTISIGSNGSKGLGGVPGSNDGLDGKAQSILEVP